MKTAILIDGGFFIRRYKYIEGFHSEDSADIMAKNLVSYCFRHIQRVKYNEQGYVNKFQVTRSAVAIR